MSGNISNHHGRAQLYQKFSFVTIVVVFLLIAIGGIVRSSGAGMGCPDWPKCFDQWVPPTDVSELPANYQQIYHDRGYADTSFNAVKTWTEYLNRLFGVLTGFFIILHLIFAYRAFKQSNPIVWKLAVAALILVIIQGGVGAFVVMTNLHQGIITIHLVIALIIAALLLAARAYSQPQFLTTAQAELKSFERLVILVGLLLLVQIILGTQVREAIDAAAKALPMAGKQEWLRSLGTGFAIHKVFSMITTAGVVYLTYRVNTVYASEKLNKYGIFALLLTGAQVFTGVALNQFALPAVPQALHIVFSSAAFGVLFWLWMAFYRHQRPHTQH